MDKPQKIGLIIEILIQILTLIFVSGLIIAPAYYLHNYQSPFHPIAQIEGELNMHQTTPEFNKIFSKAKDSRVEQIERDSLQNQINSVEALFARYNSPMSGYAELIIKRAVECGGDYRIIIAIAGNESGFGRIPYKLYNPYGYLDGVQYSGWEESLYIITCKVSAGFLAPCNQDLNCIINKYGGHDTDKPKWVRNIQYFMNQL